MNCLQQVIINDSLSRSLGEKYQASVFTFSFAAVFVSKSIQLTYFRLSSNAHLISATISSAWSTNDNNTDRKSITPSAHSRSSYCEWQTFEHLQWPCCSHQRWLWQTWLQEQSPGRYLCHWHTASSVGCRSGARNKDIVSLWCTIYYWSLSDIPFECYNWLLGHT